MHFTPYACVIITSINIFLYKWHVIVNERYKNMRKEIFKKNQKPKTKKEMREKKRRYRR